MGIGGKHEKLDSFTSIYWKNLEKHGINMSDKYVSLDEILSYEQLNLNVSKGVAYIPSYWQ